MECSTKIECFLSNSGHDPITFTIPSELGKNSRYCTSENNIRLRSCPDIIVVNGYHNDKRNFSSCKTHGHGKDVTALTDYPCLPTIRLTNYMGNYGGSESYVDFIIKPIPIDPNNVIYTLNGKTTEILPKDTRIQIEAPSGYHSSNYHWQYKIGDSGAISDLPSEFQGKNTIEICRNDFISNTFSTLDEKIYIILNQGCPELPLIQKVLNVQIESPGIANVNTHDPTCNTEPNGEIIVEIDRDLYNVETLLAKLFIPNPAINEPPILVPSRTVEHVEGNKYKIGGLSQGIYEIEIFSYFGIDKDRPTLSDQTDKYYRSGIKINDAPPFKITNIKKFDPVCFGVNDGVVEVSAEGGSGLYWVKCKYIDGSEYQSVASAGITTLAGLPPGEFDLVLYDSNNCIFDDVLAIEELAEPNDRMYLFEEFVKEASLDENNLEELNGVLSISIDGGVAPYQVTWKTTDANGTEIFSEQTNENISSLRNINSGKYFVEVKDDNGCVISKTMELPKAPEIHFSFTQTGIIQCQEDMTGELSVQITGGNAPFKFVWYKNDVKWKEESDKTATEVLSGLDVGKYQLMITDNIGSKAWSREITLKELTIISLSFETEMLKCPTDYDGYLRLSVSGGNAPYSYQWSNGGTEDEITDLHAGDYSVRVVDANGCPSSGTGTVQAPEPLSVTSYISNPFCIGMSNGNITLQISGGTAPYKIWWNGDSDETYREFIQDLSAGNYMVKVTDQYNCDTIEETYLLEDPTPVSITIEEVKYITSFDGSDGKLSVSVQGGSKPYVVTAKSGTKTYNYQKTVVQPDQSVLYEFLGLKAGDYVIEVKDAHYLNNAAYSSCKGEVFATIIQPPKLIIRTELTKKITCYGGDDGQFIAHVEGGVPLTGQMPYSYQWYKIVNGVKQAVNCTDSIFSNASHGKYQISIKDSYNVESFAEVEIKEPQEITLRLEITEILCGNPNSGSITSYASGGDGEFKYLWSSGEDSSAITGKPKGHYSLKITDERGCSLSKDTVIINPTEISFNYEIFVQTCANQNDASIFLNPEGGKMPYTYIWSTGSDQMFIKDLGSGTYTVTVIDDNLCESDTSFVIPDLPAIEVQLLTLKQPKAMGYSDGSLSVEITGGNQPYKITWYDEQENILADDSLSIKDDKAYSGLNDLATGTYKLRIEDINYPLSQNYGYTESGCVHEFSVFLPEPPKLEVSISESHVISCNGQSDGAIASTAQGGVPFENGLPYLFTWYYNNEPLSAISNPEATGLKAGIYRLKITDSNGIEAWSEQLELSQPGLLQVTLKSADLKCSRDNDGWAEATVTGGTAPYSYEWSTGNTTPRIEQVSRGTYMVWVRDNRACEVLGKVRIVQPDSIYISSTLISPICNGGSNGEIRINVTGGTSPYRYEWEDGSISPNRNGLKTGNYTLKVSDINECSYETETFFISEPESVKIDLGTDRELCAGQDHEVEAIVSEPAHTFKWFSPQGTLLHTGNKYRLSDPGTYRVVATTNKGCEATGNISISRNNRKIEAEFMVASKVPINDDVYFVNITTSGSDSVRWVLPESDAYAVINEDEKNLQVIFNEFGSYIFGMRSFYEKCYETVYKTVTVMNKFDIEGYEDVDSPTLKIFNAYPNPAREHFSVDIELGKASKGTLLLIDTGTGKIIERRVLQQNKKFRETFDVPGKNRGTYLLHLIAPEVRSSLKVIIK